VRTIGLLGGMSFESTLPYYRIVNETVREALGGLHSARIVLYSVDFHDVERMQSADDWTAAGALLADAARRVEAAGADFLVLCTNTMHKVAPAIECAVAIPLLHIADPTAAAIAHKGLRKVALLGTRFTMEQAFYRERLATRGIATIVPDDAGREWMHRTIYDELCQGIVREEARVRLRELIARFAARGAEGVILGCTEIAMLIDHVDAAVPAFDTARLHAEAAAHHALSDDASPSARGEAHAASSPSATVQLP
jgi:aspartate racemase